MSRIQKILEKAERDGSIPRSTEVAFVSDAALHDLDAPVSTPPPGISIGAAPAARTPAPARLRTTSTPIDARLRQALTPGSPTAEQYRTLRTRILHAGRGRAANALLVTSPGRGDGKTQTAACLGLTMAQESEQRVCMIDADLRHPQLQSLFGLPKGPGLSDVLDGRATLEEALVRIEDYQITVLPAGDLGMHPAELLGTPAMRRVLQALRTQFDRIVLDAPAAAPLADVALLSPLVDGLMLVVRAGMTTKPTIHDAIASLDGGKLLGIVLNDTH